MMIYKIDLSCKALALLILSIIGSGSIYSQATVTNVLNSKTTKSTTSKGLKDYYKKYFPIGVSVSPSSIKGADSALIVKEFNSITPENAMKFALIHPEENTYNWKDADAMVDFATANKMKMRGHTLVWHLQYPSWLFKDATDTAKTVTKEVLLKRLKDHITSVVGRYKGKIYAWDVVNEAVDDDSTKFLRNSLWYQVCGEDFIAKAFEYAHEADPNAVLFYNDYRTEWPERRERIYTLLKKLLDAKVPVHGVGLQAHWSLVDPTQQELINSIERFSSLGLKLQFTEVDMSVLPPKAKRDSVWRNSPDIFSVEQEQKQTERYKMAFDIFRKYKNVVTGVTFWNVSDKTTWLDETPSAAGKKNYPLLFDSNLNRKKAYWAVVNF